jgi:hypothetical protein
MTQKKVTLSIPELLYEKLEEWRNSFNLSKMFQEALTDAIQRKEEFQKRFSEDFDITDIIKRLKQEKLLWDKEYFKIGKLEGFKWASTAHYEDLLYVFQTNNTYQLVSDSKFKDYFYQAYKNSKLSQYQNLENRDHGKMFIDGWENGVLEFWNQVKEGI